MKLRLSGVTSVSVDSEAQIAALGTGGFAVVWRGGTDDGQGTDVFVRQFTTAGVETAATRLQGSAGNLADQSAQVTALEGGGFVVAWQAETPDGQGWDIFVQRFAADGTAAGGAARVAAAAGSVQDTLPQVAALEDGGYAVVWQSLSDGETEPALHLQRFAADGTAAPAQQVTGPGLAGQEAEIAALPDGGFVLAWRAEVDGAASDEVVVRAYAADGTPGADSVLVGATAGADRTPRIAMLDSGDYVVTWFGEIASGKADIFVQKFDGATHSPTGGMATLEGMVGAYDNQVQIAALPGDGYVVVWGGGTTDGQAYDVHIRQFDEDSNLVAQARLRGIEGNLGDILPQVTVLGDGGYAVAWMGHTGTDYDIFVQSFDATGVPRDGLQRLQGLDGTTLTDNFMQIIPVGTAGYAVAWSGRTGDGGDDIFVQIVCFTAGTRIAVPGGERLAEDLAPGDLVLTRDHGAQPLRWAGRRQLTARQLAANPRLRPVRIPAGALGPGRPAADLLVSPQHRILVRSPIVARMTGAAEALVAARHLVGHAGIAVAGDVAAADYVHLLFDRHEIVLSNGAETESLHTGPEALKAIDPATLAELCALFPALTRQAHARPVLQGRQARRLAVRHAENDRALHT